MFLYIMTMKNFSAILALGIRRQHVIAWNLLLFQSSQYGGREHLSNRNVCKTVSLKIFIYNFEVSNLRLASQSLLVIQLSCRLINAKREFVKCFTVLQYCTSNGTFRLTSKHILLVNSFLFFTIVRLKRSIRTSVKT